MAMSLGFCVDQTVNIYLFQMFFQIENFPSFQNLFFIFEFFKMDYGCDLRLSFGSNCALCYKRRSLSNSMFLSKLNSFKWHFSVWSLYFAILIFSKEKIHELSVHQRNSVFMLEIKKTTSATMTRESSNFMFQHWISQKLIFQFFCHNCIFRTQTYKIRSAAWISTAKKNSKSIISCLCTVNKKSRRRVVGAILIKSRPIFGAYGGALFC